MHRVARWVTTLTLIAALGLLGGCGDDAQAPAPAGPIDPGQPIEVTIDGDSVTPNGARVRIERDQRVTLVVTADRAGEMHLHSTPEQTFAYTEGTTEIEVVIDRPGVADLELHDPERIVLQFEVH